MEISMNLIKELRNRTHIGLSACREALQKTDGNVDAAIELLKKAGELKAAAKAGTGATEGQILTLVSHDAKSAAIAQVNCQTDFTARTDEFTNFAFDVTTNILWKNQDIESKRVALIAKTSENIVVTKEDLVKATETEKIFTYSHSNKKIGVIVAISNLKDENLGYDVAMQIAGLNPSSISIDDLDSSLVEKQKEIFMAHIKDDPKIANKPEQAIQSILAGKMNKWYKEVCLIEQDSLSKPGKAIKELLGDSKISKFIRYEI